MVRFAVIADIHSNILALQAVLGDIAEQGIESIYCAGDLVGYSPYPNEVIDLVRVRRIPTVQGNYDAGVGENLMACGCDYPDEAALERGAQSLFWTQEHTLEQNKAFLRDLPKEIQIKAEGSNLLLVHGSPRQNNEYLYADSPVLPEVIRLIDTDGLICGHTHIPYYRRVGDKHVINAGSVGKPKHGSPDATYVVIEVKGNSLAVEIKAVRYDFEMAAKAIEDSELPAHFAKLLREGRG